MIAKKTDSVDGSAESVMPGDPLVGTTVLNRYDITSVIGFGGWSVVYRAFDKSLNRLVAIKAMHPHLCVDQGKLLRFQREAQASSALTHQNLAVVYDCDLLWAGRPYISMEIVEGETLAETINRGEPPDIEKAVAIFIQICNGLEAIHNAGLIHRDLKPGNIKVSDAGAVKVLDFGCAKWILQEQNLLTKTDESFGTPAYMSPEQCLGKPLDSRSDIYSLGCAMYEFLTGRRPFGGDNLLDCMRMHIKTMPPAFCAAQPAWKIPEGLEAVIFKALAKDPKDRYSSAAELRDALSTSIRDLSFKAKLSEPWQRLGARRRQQVLISISLLILVGSVSAMGLYQTSRTRQIRFPESHEVGVLFIIKKDSNGKDAGRDKLGPAEGVMSVPLTSYIQLAEIPKTEAEKLSFLQKLGVDDLQRIDLSGTSPQVEAIVNINRLSNINSLSFNSTTISDEALEQLRLKNLVGLDLTATTISDRSILPMMAGCPNLHWIQLRGNAQVTDRAVMTLSLLPQLNALLLQEVAHVTDACLTRVGKSKSIKTLVLRGDNITDIGVAYLAPTTQLNTLDLSDTHITSSGINTLAKLTNLRNVNLSETKIDDGCIAALAKMTQLKTLNIDSTAISPGSIRKLKTLLPDCEIKASG